MNADGTHEDDPADLLGPGNCQRQGHRAAETVADDIDLAQFERVEDVGEVLRP